METMSDVRMRADQQECRRRRRHHAVLKINPLNSHPIIFAYTHSVLCFTTCCLLYLRFLDIKHCIFAKFFLAQFLNCTCTLCTVHTMFLIRSCYLALVFRILAYLMIGFFFSVLCRSSHLNHWWLCVFFPALQWFPSIWRKDLGANSCVYKPWIGK